MVCKRARKQFRLAYRACTRTGKGFRSVYKVCERACKRFRAVYKACTRAGKGFRPEYKACKRACKQFRTVYKACTRARKGFRPEYKACRRTEKLVRPVNSAFGKEGKREKGTDNGCARVEIHPVLGVGINAVGVVIGGLVGLFRKVPLTAANESFFKVAAGAATVAVGLHLSWKGFNGSFLSVMKQLLLVMIAMSLGKFFGKAMRLQKLSNSFGKYATDKLARVQGGKGSANDGFVVTSLLLCANPFGFFAAVDEGLNGFSLAFIIKAAVDGMAALSFISIFGWSVLFAIIPLIAWQGTIVLLARYWQPFLLQHGLIDSINATNGLLIFCVALIILSLKKIELADYVPSLAIAPWLLWIFR